MYKVIKHFTDLQDGRHPYNVGDTFPREGLTVSAKRIAELSGSNNRQGVPLIKEVVDDTEKKEPVKPEKKTSASKRGKKVDDAE